MTNCRVPNVEDSTETTHGLASVSVPDDTVTGVKDGALDFTIDQSPYLQGFLSVLYLYLFRLSGTLVAPPVTDTGLTFVTKENVGPYQSTKSRYEGSDSAVKLIERSGAIAHA